MSPSSSSAASFAFSSRCITSAWVGHRGQWITCECVPHAQLSQQREEVACFDGVKPARGHGTWSAALVADQISGCAEQDGNTGWEEEPEGMAELLLPPSLCPFPTQHSCPCFCLLSPALPARPTCFLMSSSVSMMGCVSMRPWHLRRCSLWPRLMTRPHLR